MNKDTPITINQESKKANRAFQKRIFYVEDDQDSATMMTIILNQAGYDVTVARTLEGCLETIKGGDFDLILLDNWLKKDSGIELCEKIRAFDSHIPIMFYTGAAYEADIQEGMDAGANAYLIKPNGVNVIVETIAGLIGDKTMTA